MSNDVHLSSVKIKAVDDGAGSLSCGGTAIYDTGALYVNILPPRLEYSYTNTGYSVGWTGREVTGSFPSGIVTARYIFDSASPTSRSIQIDLPHPVLKFGGDIITDSLVPGALIFRWAGQEYREYGQGVVFRHATPWADEAGIQAGTVNYASREVTLTDYVSGTGAVTVVRCLTRFGQWLAREVSFRTEIAPLKSESIAAFLTAADGTPITASAAPDGSISAAHVTGSASYQFGTVHLDFDTDVDPTTLRYNAVAISYLPLDPEILGMHPERLPSDGRVTVFRKGGMVVVMHSAVTSPATITNGQSISCGRTRLGWVRVLDSAGATVSGDLYTLDRAAGTVTFPNVSSISQPMRVKHTVADLRMIDDAQISGYLRLSRGLSHDYPDGESLVASCLINGNVRARVSASWDQATWNGVWQDTIIGSPAGATLDLINYPIEMTNFGAENERWVLLFTSSTTATLFGERRGVVWSGAFTKNSADIAPINPRTRTRLENGTYTGGVPFMIIKAASNGGGWSEGNCFRFNTIGAMSRIVIVRTIQQSDEPAGAGLDGCEIQALGNIKRS